MSRRACKQLIKALLGYPTLTQPVLSMRCSKSPQSQHTGTWITWKPLAQSKNKQPRVPESWTVSQNNKMQYGMHSCEKSQSHAIHQPSYNLPSLREHCDTGSQFFGSWNQLTHNSPGSFHCCLHAVVPHCILHLQIPHGAWIVKTWCSACGCYHIKATQGVSPSKKWKPFLCNSTTASLLTVSSHASSCLLLGWNQPRLFLKCWCSPSST